MVEVFGIKDRRAEALGRGEKRGVIVIDTEAPRELQPGADISLIHRYKWACPEKYEPTVKRAIDEQRFSSGNCRKLGQCLAGDAEDVPTDEFHSDRRAALITIPLRSRVEEDVRVEK